MSDAVIKVLSDKEHVLLNSDMYVGSLSMEQHDVLIDGKFVPTYYIPGLVKITDELIDNSVDEAIRTNFKHANQIEVTVDIDANTVVVCDNGRGIPQHTVETPEGQQIPGPMAAWTRARAGGNFIADRKTIGKNGVGAALTNFFSDRFIGITCDGKNTVTVICANNAEHVSYKTTPGGEQGTKVTFQPDFSRFGIFRLDENFVKVIRSRMEMLAVNFPKIRFKFNGKRIDSKFKTFIADFGEVVSDSTDNYGLMLATSQEFRQLSFVNGVHTKQGGTHVNGVIDELSEELIAMVKRKHKVEITKARIKESLLIALFVRDLTSPKYDGQTKERLSSPWGQVRDHMGIDYKALARRVMNTEGVIMPIIENALARKEAADKAAATKAEKKAKKANIAKHVKANGIGRHKCTLFLTEGDSAIGFFAKARDENTQGGYPLRGKILNVWEETDATVLGNKEIFDLLSILNVGLRSKERPAYDKIAVMVDADQDGKGSIYPLLLAFFYKYWPHWYEEGRIYFVKTPEYISTNGKTTVWCYGDEEFRSKSFTGRGWEHRHIKGLGSLTEEEYAKCIQDPYLEKVVLGDNAEELFSMLFSGDVSKRKEWLGFTGDDSTEEENES